MTAAREASTGRAPSAGGMPLPDALGGEAVCRPLAAADSPAGASARSDTSSTIRGRASGDGVDRGGCEASEGLDAAAGIWRHQNTAQSSTSKIKD